MELLVPKMRRKQFVERGLELAIMEKEGRLPMLDPAKLRACEALAASFGTVFSLKAVVDQWMGLMKDRG